MRISLFVLVSMLSLPTFAAPPIWRAESLRFDAESPTLVRCFFDPAARRSVFFDWDRREVYRRAIRYRVSRLPGCRIAGAPAFAKLPESAFTTGELEGRKLPETIRKQLVAIRKGASAFDAKNADADFLPLAPGEDYTREMNRELTARYGAEFSANTYERWVNSAPANRAIRARLKERLRIEAGLASGSAAAVTREPIFLVSLGYGWTSDVNDPKRPQVDQDVEKVIDVSGAEVEYLVRPSHGSVEGNGAIIAKTIAARVDSGRDVVLVGLSKGTPDAIVGIALAERAARERPATTARGKVLGLISFSSMGGGTFLAGVETKLPLLKHAARLGVKTPIAGYRDFSRTVLDLKNFSEELMQSTVARHAGDLPKDAVYLDLSGVSSEYGLPLASGLPAIRDIYRFNRAFRVSPVAHDGMVDYPSLLPKGISPAHYVVAVKGTHYIFDGRLDELDLTRPELRRVLVKAVFKSFLELYAENFDAKNRRFPRK